jgi:hypothetical protein
MTGIPVPRSVWDTGQLLILAGGRIPAEYGPDAIPSPEDKKLLEIPSCLRQQT